MSMSASSSYSLYTLTSGTTLTVSESMDVLMIMNASFSDESNERLAGIEKMMYLLHPQLLQFLI